MKSSFAKFMKDEEMQALVEKMNGKPGDLLLFAADKSKKEWLGYNKLFESNLRRTDEV